MERCIELAVCPPYLVPIAAEGEIARPVDYDADGEEVEVPAA